MTPIRWLSLRSSGALARLVAPPPPPPGAHAFLLVWTAYDGVDLLVCAQEHETEADALEVGQALLSARSAGELDLGPGVELLEICVLPPETA